MLNFIRLVPGGAPAAPAGNAPERNPDRRRARSLWPAHISDLLRGIAKKLQKASAVAHAPKAGCAGSVSRPGRVLRERPSPGSTTLEGLPAGGAVSG